MKRLLVTGRHGFVGETVASLVASDPTLSHWYVVDLPAHLDVRDPLAVAALIDQCRPDAVMHLAAQSWVPDALRDPETTLQVNLIGTLHLLAALRRSHFDGPFLFASTGDVYGLVPAEVLPLNESRLPAPRNPYAVSKLAGEALCFQWSVTDQMHIVIARAFNHIGPGQSERFAVSDFARQIAEIKLGRREPVVHAGDIDVTRDFTDVRDVVYAYFSLLDAGATGETYNVCSGTERTVRSLLERLAALARVDVRVEQDAQRLRPSEQRRVRGDPGKIRSATGWRVSTSIDDSLRSMLDYWEHAITNA